MSSMATSALDEIVTTKAVAADDFLHTSDSIAALAERIAEILRDAVALGAPFTAVTLDVDTDPEASDWSELVFSVAVRGDFSEITRWSNEISGRRAEVSQELPKHEEAILARSNAVHLLPEG